MDSRLSEQVPVGGIAPPAAPGLALLNLSVSAQNCNSLNVSALAKNTKSKVTAIMSLNSDIIFLSDIRLGNKAGHVSDLFRLKYRFYHHSTQAKRGVAILIRNDRDFTLTQVIKDGEENCILLEGSIAGKNVILASVYGPNEDNKMVFEFL